MRKHARSRLAAIAIAVTMPAGTGLLACNAVLGLDDVELGDCHTGDKQCKNGQPQTCNGDRHWQDDAPCDGQTCVEGRCQGICELGTRQCGAPIPPATWSRNPQQCREDGEEWVSDAVACEFVCEGGQCGGECVPLTVGCQDNTPRTCDENGQWQNPTACADSTCKNGECVGICEVGATRCSGLTPQQCDADGMWTDETPCQFVCSAHQCIGVCMPSPVPMSCLNNTPQNCNDDGEWQDQAPPCTGQTCKNGNCVGICEPGTKRCAGLTPQECDPNGEWQNSAPPCTGIGEKCSGGLCVVVCTPGDLRCNDLQPQFCNMDGDWMDSSGSACGNCVGCNVNTGLCNPVTSPEPLGTACDDGNDCTFVAECDGMGNCVASTGKEVQCIAANECSPGQPGQPPPLTQCNASTGSCAEMNGAWCDDGNVCTTAQSVCQNGACAPGGDHAWAHWKLNPPRPRRRSDSHRWNTLTPPTTNTRWCSTISRICCGNAVCATWQIRY